MVQKFCTFATKKCTSAKNFHLSLATFGAPKTQLIHNFDSQHVHHDMDRKEPVTPHMNRAALAYQYYYSALFITMMFLLPTSFVNRKMDSSPLLVEYSHYCLATNITARPGCTYMLKTECDTSISPVMHCPVESVFFTWVYAVLWAYSYIAPIARCIIGIYCCTVGPKDEKLLYGIEAALFIFTFPPLLALILPSTIYISGVPLLLDITFGAINAWRRFIRCLIRCRMAEAGE